MECIIFIGIQGAGKSTFYKERFFNSHIRINLDMLKTRHREAIYLAASLQARQPFVVDNTNPSREDRARYVEPAKNNGFHVAAYYFEPDYDASLIRNAKRAGKANIPAAAIRRTLNKMEIPTHDEGFDRIFSVTIAEHEFHVAEIKKQ